LVSAAVFFAAGLLAAHFREMPAQESFWFATGIVLWGVVVRTTLSWQIAASVNSVTHRWGYRNYETNDDSRNNFVVGLLAHGEGWHNNHHADPSSAKHGHKWWEFDLTYCVIRILMVLGLAKDVVMPKSSAKCDSGHGGGLCGG
jgi:fatty-acid desaturase